MGEIPTFEFDIDEMPEADILFDDLKHAGVTLAIGFLVDLLEDIHLITFGTNPLNPLYVSVHKRSFR